MNIGFIGLGIMGKPMLRNLIKAGHRVAAYGNHEEDVALAVAAGAGRAASAADAARGAEVVVTMLPNSPQVKTAVCGPDGVLEGARPGTVYIDMSSIAPLAAREVAAACAERGVAMLDAPVSGGEPGAIDGTLAIMVGGERTVYEAVREPVLLKMGASAVYCGDIGAGNTAKLANQVMVAANIAAVAEAFTLARQAGVDPELVFQAVKGGLAGSRALEAKLPKMLAGDFRPGFKIDLHIKDLANALDTGHATGSPLPLTALVMEMLQNLHAGGLGQDDHAGLAQFYAKLTGKGLWEHAEVNS